jgi:hypothetical protein
LLAIIFVVSITAVAVDGGRGRGMTAATAAMSAKAVPASYTNGANGQNGPSIGHNKEIPILQHKKYY